MSRYELAPLARTDVHKGAIGWDRALQTFFVQLFSRKEPEEEHLLLWAGTSPGEIASAGQAIGYLSDSCVIPEGLAEDLERDRASTARTPDTAYQRDLKTRFGIRTSP